MYVFVQPPMRNWCIETEHYKTFTSHEIIWTAHVAVVIVDRQIHTILGGVTLWRVLRVSAIVDEIAT